MSNIMNKGKITKEKVGHRHSSGSYSHRFGMFFWFISWTLGKETSCHLFFCCLVSLGRHVPKNNSWRTAYCQWLKSTWYNPSHYSTKLLNSTSKLINYTFLILMNCKLLKPNPILWSPTSPPTPYWPSKNNIEGLKPPHFIYPKIQKSLLRVDQWNVKNVVTWRNTKILWGKKQNQNTKKAQHKIRQKN